MTDFFYGNEKAKSLLSSLKDGRAFHAYLLCGEKGLGKRTFSAYIAAALLCHSADRPCLACGSCKKVLNNTHPDVRYFDSAGSRQGFHVDVIREIKRDAYIKPNEAEYKLYILSECENMTASAANALLKILEEPPAHVVFLLLSESKSALVPTIASRLLEVQLYPVSQAECGSALRAKFPEADGQSIAAAVFAAQGNIGKGIAFLEGEAAEGSAEEAAFAERIGKQISLFDSYYLSASFESLGKERAKAQRVIMRLLKLTRDSIFQKEAANGQDYGKSEACLLMAEHLSLNKLLKLIDILQYALQSLYKNANISLVLSNISSSITEVL